MELIAAVLLAGPLGFLARTRRAALWLYLAVWAAIFPVQTIAVYADTTAEGEDWQYWAVNAVILALGVGLNRLGHRLGQARRARRTAEATG